MHCIEKTVGDYQGRWLRETKSYTSFLFHPVTEHDNYQPPTVLLRWMPRNTYLHSQNKFFGLYHFTVYKFWALGFHTFQEMWYDWEGMTVVHETPFMVRNLVILILDLWSQCWSQYTANLMSFKCSILAIVKYLCSVQKILKKLK